MSRQRGDKLKKFQQQKEMIQKLKELSVAVEKEHVDDEVKVNISIYSTVKTKLGDLHID